MSKKDEAIQTWIEYNKEMAKAFDFHPNAQAAIPSILLEKENPAIDYDSFIIYLKNEIKIFKEAKWFGEK